MSFGQSAPSASPKQIAYLLSLVKQAGHDGFRDACGPLGLTQRQAAGKFSKSEASTLIDLLLNGEGKRRRRRRVRQPTDGSRHDSSQHDSSGSRGRRNGDQRGADLPPRNGSSTGPICCGAPAELLAGELERRDGRSAP